MLVTMFTDASLISQTNSGGWAVWAKSARGKIAHSGPLRGEVLNSGEAEAKAVANGLALVTRSVVLEPGDEVLITCDNLQVLWMLGHDQRVPNKAGFVTPRARHVICPGMKAARECIWREVQDNALAVRTRHVKAHSGRGEPRLFVHSQCDKMARAAARKLHATRTGKRYA